MLKMVLNSTDKYLLGTIFVFVRGFFNIPRSNFTNLVKKKRMKSFIVSCLLAASVLSVSTRLNGMNLLQKDSDEPVAETVVESVMKEMKEDLDDLDEDLLEEVSMDNDLDIEIDVSLMPVETAEEQVEAVTE